MMTTNCKNCGAPLHSTTCEYCGTEYEWISEINDFKQVIKINIHGRIRKFYIQCISVSPSHVESTRLCDGGHYVSCLGGEQIELNLVSYD